MFSRPKILFLVSLLFVALLNPQFNPYLPFKFLIFYHPNIITRLLFNLTLALYNRLKDHVYKTIVINSNRQILLLCLHSMFYPPVH